MIRLLYILPLSLITACSHLSFDTQTKGLPQADPDGTIAEVQALNRRGSRTQALLVLREAGRTYPSNPNIQSLLEKMELAWAIEQQYLEDQLLLVEVTGLLESIPLLQRLSDAEPTNLLLKARLHYRKRVLELKLPALMACGQAEREDLLLARKCLQRAETIAPSEQVSQQLEQLEARLAARKRAYRIRRQGAEPLLTEPPQQRRAKENRGALQQQQRQLDQLLLEAERDIELGALGNAMVKLDQALQQDPDNQEARSLIEEARSAVERQVEALVQLGDRLYRQEQIGPAVAVWEAAAKLKPGQEQLDQKLERARKVLDKLETIRARMRVGDEDVPP